MSPGNTIENILWIDCWYIQILNSSHAFYNTKLLLKNFPTYKSCNNVNFQRNAAFLLFHFRLPEIYRWHWIPPYWLLSPCVQKCASSRTHKIQKIQIICIWTQTQIICKWIQISVPGICAYEYMNIWIQIISKYFTVFTRSWPGYSNKIQIYTYATYGSYGITW